MSDTDQTPLSFDEFHRVEMRIGTVLEASLNAKARKPAYILKVDFGTEIGIKTSSAQLTELYQPEDIIGCQVVAVMNFPPLRIAGVKSEILVLAGVTDTNGTILLQPDRNTPNGTRVS